MNLVFRLLDGVFQVREVAFATNSRLSKTQGVPAADWWLGPTQAQLRVLNRPAYLRKLEGGLFGPAVFAAVN